MTLKDSNCATSPAIGIDIGGTEVKAAVVDVRDGTLMTKRRSVRTPRHASPRDVAKTILGLIEEFDHGGPVGVAYPGVIVGGKAQTAVNLNPQWLGVCVAEIVGDQLCRPVSVLNDADAAGLAEAIFGAGMNSDGLQITVTFGTGIGTALINRGRLVPNAELGHLEIDGQDAEIVAAASAIQRDRLSWPEWAARANRYLEVLESLLWPELIVIGGGVSATPQQWVPHLKARARIVPAALSNDAGIVGAALATTARHVSAL